MKYLDKLHRVITALDCYGKYNTYAVCVLKTASGIILDVATSVQVHSVFTSKTWGTYVLYLSLVVVIVVGYVSNKDYRKSLIYLPIYIYTNDIFIFVWMLIMCINCCIYACPFKCKTDGNRLLTVCLVFLYALMFSWKYDIFSQSLLLLVFVAFFCIIMNSNKRWGILYHRQIYCCFIIFVIVASKTKNTKTPQYWPFVSEIFRPPLSLQMSWHLTRPLIHTMMTEELDMFSSHQGFRNALVDRIM